MDKRIKVKRESQRPNTYFLEKPPILAQKLLMGKVAKRTDGTFRLADPDDEDLQQVCREFFDHVTGRSYSFYKKHQTAGNRIDVNPERKRQEPKTATKAKMIKDWLLAEGRMSCIMPNATNTVLHYRTILQTHQAFILSQEQDAKVEWADRASTAIFKDLLDSEDVDDSAPQEVLHESEYRYGNKLLGRLRDAPVLATLPTYSYFATVWYNDKELRRTVTVRKWIPFAKCDYCSRFNEEVADTMDKKAKARLREWHAPHIALVKREREKYESNRNKAIHSPEEYLSLIIDGADAQRFSLPHFAQASHASNVAMKLRSYLIGCIAHGRDTYIYQVPSNHAQGHNVTIQVLFEVLVDRLEKEGTLPPVLFLQLDNTTKQNKGRFLYTFLASLVDAGVFTVIYVNFLPVGHTHEDIDQFFSRISVYLRVRSALTPDAMNNRIKESYKKYNKRPIVKRWLNVGNVSEYFGQYVTDSTYKKITEFNAVKFTRVNGQVVYQYKSYPGGDPTKDYWRTADGGLHKEVFDGRQRPDLVRDYDDVPNGKAATHVALAGEEGYEKAQAEKWDSLEKLFDAFPTKFSEDVRLALKAAWSTESEQPSTVAFDWNKADIQKLYNCNSNHRAEEADAQEMAIEALGIDLDHDERRSGRVSRENCVLTTGRIYVTRPNERKADDGQVILEPFCLCKIKHVVEDPTGKGGGEGAHVQWLDISTNELGRNWVEDPWHINDHNMNVPKTQLDWLPVTDFHDYVEMAKWYPRDDEVTAARLINTTRGIKRWRIAKKHQNAAKQWAVLFAQGPTPQAEQ